MNVPAARMPSQLVLRALTIPLRPAVLRREAVVLWEVKGGSPERLRSKVAIRFSAPAMNL